VCGTKGCGGGYTHSVDGACVVTAVSWFVWQGRDRVGAAGGHAGHPRGGQTHTAKLHVSHGEGAEGGDGGGADDDGDDDDEDDDKHDHHKVSVYTVGREAPEASGVAGKGVERGYKGG
jgi:hypothetical protein